LEANFAACSSLRASRNLNLEGNPLERDGVMHLSQGLSFNASLTSLNLTMCSFGGDGDKIPGEVEAIKYLAVGLAGCKTLKTVQMDGNLIGNLGLQILLEATAQNQLTHLTDFSFTPFVESEVYKQLVDKIESQRPKKKKKVRNGTLEIYSLALAFCR
jgi:Ran GTPase-activating protein (RanGAP) involved in mRNA processing and transport